jgi:rod shape-determining protein MreC
MLEASSRHRPTLLLAVVLLIQVLLLAFQIKRGRDIRLIRIWSVEAMTPLQRAGTWFGGTLHSGWKGYVDLRHARAENDALRQELARLQLRNDQLESRAQEQERLEKLLNFREAYPSVPMLAAEVIGANADSSSQTLYINRGQGDGLRRNMGVITPAGVVGKILEVFPGTSQVLLMSDRDSGVGAMLSSSRTHGVVKGTGGSQLRMDYVVNDEKLTPGEPIVTSGDDRIFPKDLPVGTAVGAQPGNPFQSILVKPAVRLDRLEEVIVLLGTAELPPIGGSEAVNEAHPAAGTTSILSDAAGGAGGSAGKKPVAAPPAPGPTLGAKPPAAKPQ